MHQSKLVAYYFIIACFITLLFNYILPGGINQIGSYQLNMSGDGLKNYYTFAYALKYDQLDFTNGLFYPYGDIGTYFDNQPLLVLLMRPLFDIGVIEQNDIFALLLITILSSFLIAGIILFRLALEFNVKPLVALLFALVCISLSPQLFRMAAHYSLSYAVFIPLTVLLCIRYEKKEQKIWLLLVLILMSFLSSGIHPYIMLSCCMFIFSFGAIGSIFKKKLQISLLIGALIPIIAFQVLFYFFDPYQDRPLNPYGIWQYKTEVSDLFPFYGWFNDLFKELLQLNSGYSEGYCYPGFLWMLFVIFIPVLVFYKFFKGKSILKLSYIEKLIGIASLIVLSFSMGIHMILTNKAINDWIPALAQFRGLGRFSWSFYYVGSLILFVQFDRWIRILNIGVRKWLIITPVILLYINDAYQYVTALKMEIETYKSENLLRDNTILLKMLENKNLILEDIQAIIPLPIGTEGMEKLSYRDHFVNKINVLPLSYQTGIPITTCIQSRASISRTMALLQLTNSVYGDNSIKSNFDRKKDFLIIVPNKIEERYFDILKRAEFIDKNNDLSIFRITWNGLFKREQIDTEYQSEPIDYQNIFWRSFDESEINGLLSEGAFKSSEEDRKILDLNIDVDTVTIFQLSFWQYIEPIHSEISEYQITSYHDDGSQKCQYNFRDWDLERVEVNGNWVRFNRFISLDAEEKKFTLTVSKSNIVIDNVLLMAENKHFKVDTSDPCWIYVDHYLVNLCDN